MTYPSLSKEGLSLKCELIVLMDNASADVVGQVPGLALDELGYEGRCHLD
jgi:hypothetical protein